ARADAKSDLATLYAEVRRDPAAQTGRRLFLLGQLAELVDPPAALAWFDEVPRENERWFNARVRVIVLTDQQGKHEQALTLLEQLRGDAADDKELGDVFLLEGELRAQQKDAAAVAVYTRGLLQLPNDSRLLYARAMAEIERDDLAAAERDLRRIIALEPENAEAMNALGYTLADRTPRTAEALQLIEQALALRPDEPAILDSLGWAQFRLGLLAEAEKSLRRAFAGQADGEIAAHLGEVLWVRGERGEARTIWQRAAKQAPDNAVLKETMRRLDQ
ncbi:MAG: tetratricopeptide repeat protein, partial [Dokdonella sp.]